MVAELGATSRLREEGAGGDCDSFDFDPAPSAGGSCSTGRGVVCAFADDASLERMGGGGEAPGGTTVTPGVVLVARALSDDEGLDDEGPDVEEGDVEERDDAPRLVSRVPDDDDSAGRAGASLEEDELESLVGCESFGGDLSQSDLPLEATFDEY